MRRRLGLLALSLAAAALVASTTASAVTAAPALRVSTSTPDYVTPNKLMLTWVSVLNSGADPLTGELTVRYTFPSGIAPVYTEEQAPGRPNPLCNTVGQVTECTTDVSSVLAGQQIRYKTIAEVASDATGGAGEIEVFGGGAAEDITDPFSMTVSPPGPFAIKAFDVGLSDGPVVSATRAGSDPAEVATSVKLVSEAQSNFDVPNPNVVVTAPSESFRDTIVHVPPGFVGNPAATAVRCTPSQLTSRDPEAVIPKCPLESQIGLVQIDAGDIVPLYNVVPPSGSPAEFGFFYQSIVVTLLPKLRPSDNGIDIVTLKTPNSIPIPKFEVTLWGNPSDSSHDRLRGTCLEGGYGYNAQFGDCSLKTRSDVPFLRTPTSCPGTPLPWSIEMDTYEHVGTWVQNQTTTPAMEGCESNPFDPDLALAPSSRAARAPSGLDVAISMKQDAAINGLAPADVRSATVALPEGVTINPASADGLAACTDAQLRLGFEGPSNCPDAAKLGSLELTTPLLEDPIGGSVYLRSQASQDPASGDLYRLALEIRSDERGVDIKLPGSLKVDPDTGQLTTSFADLPQLPFESMQLHLRTGPRAPLTTPQTCGTYTTHAELTGWNGAVETADPSFTIDRDCTPAAFDPGFEAGVENATAGQFSPFTLRVTRDSGQPNLSRIEATLPEGELAKLAGVPVCSAEQATTGSCPEASRIGHVIAGIGEGTNPLFLPQAGKAPTAVYLAAPYKSAPYSILTEVPAQAGPFDLGEVLVRSALRVDPDTTQASVLSDPLPQIFAGVPIAYRDVRVNVDRPRFTINPTDCEPSEVTGQIGSTQGGSAAVSDRFQVTDCASLGFGPRLSLKLTGPTSRGANPKLRAVLRMPTGGANIERAQVALPRSEFLDQAHIGTICTRVQYAAGEGGGAQCPPKSVYGHAVAHTPLLDEPLRGPVYLRSSDHKLPDLVASLDGAIHVNLDGRIDTDRRHGIRTTFEAVPDAPVSSFVLTMKGGSKGLLQNSESLCARKRRATARFDAQNGRSRDFRPVVKPQCAGKGKRKR